MLTDTISTNGTTAKTARSPATTEAGGGSAAAGEPRPSAAESSRRNGQKSRGPRTLAGKERSRYNALTHGMTARSTLLPGEDGAEWEANRRRLQADLAPRNELEADVIERMAHAAWTSLRARRAAAARRAHRLRHAPRAQIRAEKEHVIKLGQYLLKETFRPVGMLPSERLGGHRHPARLLLKLESTLTGCDWLLSRWSRLKERASIAGIWVETDGFESVRLLGAYLADLASDDQVALVLLDSQCLAQDSAERAWAHAQAKDHALAEARVRAKAELAEARGANSELTPSQAVKKNRQRTRGPAYQEYQNLARQLTRPKAVLDAVRQLAGQPSSLGPCVLRLEKLNPRSIDQARQRLEQVIDAQTCRLREMRALHAQLMVEDDAGAADRLAFDHGAEGDNERRYLLAHDRHLNQTIATFLKLRKAANDGTIDAVDLEPADRLDVENAPEPAEADAAPALLAVPALAMRAGIAPPEPGGPIDAGLKREPGISEMPPIVAQMISKTLHDETTYAGAKFLRNEPGAAPCSPPDSQPPRVEAPAEMPSTPAEVSPVSPAAAAVERSAPSSPSPGPTPAPASTQSPNVTLQWLPLDFPRGTTRERWDALPAEVRSTIKAIQSEFWRATQHKHLDEQTIRKYRDYFRQYL